MGPIGYRIVGYITWNGGKIYLRRRYGHLIPSRRVVAASAVTVAVGALAVTYSARSADSAWPPFRASAAE